MVVPRSPEHPLPRAVRDTGVLVKIGRRKTLFKVTATFLSLVATIIVGEGALRLFSFEFGFYPSRVQFGHPNPVDLEERFDLDPELLWVPRDYSERVTRWVGREPAIAFMGCSCTQFGSYDRKLVEAVAESHTDTTIETVNLGVSGYSSYQGLRQFERDVLQMRPLLVTIYYGWNDHWSSFGIEDKEIGRFNLSHPEMLVGLSRRSRIVQLVSKTYFKLVWMRGGGHRPPRVSLSNFRANLEQMVTLARAQGIVPVLLTAPTSYRPDERPLYLVERWIEDLDDLLPLHQAYAQEVRDVARELDVVLVDLMGDFDTLSDDEVDLLFIKDGIHLSEAGSARVADQLYQQLERAGLIELLLQVKGPVS